MEKKERNCLPHINVHKNIWFKLNEVHYFSMFCIIYSNFRSEKRRSRIKKEINSYICKGKQNRWEESQNEKPKKKTEFKY